MRRRSERSRVCLAAEARFAQLSSCEARRRLTAPDRLWTAALHRERESSVHPTVGEYAADLVNGAALHRRSNLHSKSATGPRYLPMTQRFAALRNGSSSVRRDYTCGVMISSNASTNAFFQRPDATRGGAPALHRSGTRCVPTPSRASTAVAGATQSSRSGRASQRQRPHRPLGCRSPDHDRRERLSREA